MEQPEERSDQTRMGGKGSGVTLPGFPGQPRPEAGRCRVLFSIYFSLSGTLSCLVSVLGTRTGAGRRLAGEQARVGGGEGAENSRLNFCSTFDVAEYARTARSARSRASQQISCREGDGAEARRSGRHKKLA